MMTKKELLNQFEAASDFYRMPIKTLSAQQEMVIKDTLFFISAEQYGVDLQVPCPGEIGRDRHYRYRRASRQEDTKRQTHGRK